MADLQLGVTTPWDLADLPAADRRERMVAIADAGIDFVFTADHVSFHGGTGIDGLMRMAAVSGLEPRLGLYVGVYLLALRHPMVAARQIAELASFAGDRLTVGVGVGGEDRHEFEVCEVDPRTRGRRTDAALGLLRHLLAGETVDGDGEFFNFEAGRIKPTPDPPVPLVIGGRSDAALNRAALLGDGWLAAWCSARRFAQGIQLVGDTATAAGRRRATPWRHGIQLWVGVGSDADDARTHVAERMSKFYKLDFELFAKYTPLGSAEQIAEFLHPYVEAGASTLNLAPCGANRRIELETMAAVKELLS